MADHFQHSVSITPEHFAGLGLSEPILEAIRAIGFEYPTPIQAAVIPAALRGRDLIALAQPGSGRTTAFAIPIAERLTRHGELRALVLSPTREVALQTQAFLRFFGKKHRITTTSLIAGEKMKAQLRALAERPDILVATPGRMLDHLQRNTVSLHTIEQFVVEGVDHMLDLELLPQLRRIVQFLPPGRHTMMFSATMPAEIQELVQTMLRIPLRIDALSQGNSTEGISHRLYIVRSEDKRAVLMSLLRQEPGSTLVFTRRNADAEWLFQMLERDQQPVARIHSDRTLLKREQALDQFRAGALRILLATDVAGRAIDTAGTAHVINFDIPEILEDYLHRGLRTTPLAAAATVSTIATWEDLTMVRRIEKALGQRLLRSTVAGVEPWVEPGRLLV